MRSLPVRLRLSFGLLILVLTTAAGAAPVSVIVELAKEPAAMAAARARAAGTPWTSDQIESYRAQLRTEQQQFLSALTARGIPFTVGGVTVSDVRIDLAYTLVFNGINLTIDESLTGTIQGMPEVKAVHPDTVHVTSLDVSVPYIRAPEVYGAVKELTRFDDFREGFEGQGIYISVIDTGVDWTHEMFGGDPTPPRLGVEPAVSGRNGKVVYYLPFADFAVADGFGHGTHVASTAAGYLGFAPGPDLLPLTGDDIRLHGVAPQAKILSYKVCSDAVSIPGNLTGAIGGCLTSFITMAIEDSVSPRTVNGFPKPVAHVINMSLGGSGTPDSPTAVASDNAARLGAIVVAAAGNSGPGEGTAGAPCVGRLVTCVANSIDPSGSWSTDVLDPASVNRTVAGAVTPASGLPAAAGQRTGIRATPMGGSANPPGGSVAQYYVYVAGAEVAANWPASARGRIAITTSSLPTTFAQIAANGAAAGAVAVLYRFDGGANAVKSTIPVGVLPSADFDYLRTLINGSPNPPSGTLSSFPIRINPTHPTTAMNNTSSRGPVAGFGQVKPDVTAPGTNILAAAPPASLVGALGPGNYSSISGTSMASPHVAGAAALVKQSHPAWTPHMVRTALLNTSTNLRDDRQNPKPDSNTAERILDQGGGLVDVYEAVNIKALMGVTSSDPKLPSIVGSHSFGQVPAVNSRVVVTRSADVTITDVSGTASTYNLSVVNNRLLEHPGVSVSTPSAVIVPANGSATFPVTISIDGAQLTSGAPRQIQWYVRATRLDGAETLSMPFYLRATEVTPPPASQNAIRDDANPDQENGIDRDGRYVLSWSYPSNTMATPCGYRIDEATLATAGTVFFDNGEELLVQGANSRWLGATAWSSRPHPGTLSLGYGLLYTDQINVALAMRNPIDLPPNALVTLTFDSFEDIEADFDYAHVEASTDGANWTLLARYTGSFLGKRTIDLSSFSGFPTRLRFRFTSDQLVSFPLHQGWFIDNIRIQAAAGFSPVASVGANVSEFEISGRSDNTYSYRIVALFNDCSANPYGTLGSNIQAITVRVQTAAPTAAASVSPNPSLTGQAVTFDGSASADNDEAGAGAPIAQYHWSFGDGTTETTSSAVTTHAYAAGGTYRVALTVTDNDGESASTETLQTVREANATISGGGQLAGTGARPTFSVNVTMQNGVVTGGNVTWHDPSAKLKLQSTSITSVERVGNRATITGNCTINKKESGTFTMELVDNGAGTTDTVSIQSGAYSRSGTLGDGDVIVTP